MGAAYLFPKTRQLIAITPRLIYKLKGKSVAGIFSSKPFEALADELHAAVEWLSSLGIRYAPTRIGHYERALATLVDAFRNSNFETMRREFLPIVTALFEVNDLIEIHRNLAGNFDHELLAHAKASVSGPTNYADENVGSSSNAARNTVFELILMAKLTSAGIPLDFRLKTDVAAYFDNRSLLFECKRPQSISSLEKNIKDASRQLEAKYHAPQRSRHRGIIAIDISKLINPEFMLYVQDDDRSLEIGLSRIVDEFISRHEELWQRLPNRKTIALLIRVSLMGVNRARNELLTYCQQFGITPLNQTGPRNIQTVTSLAHAMRGAMGQS